MRGGTEYLSDSIIATEKRQALVLVVSVVIL